MADNLGVSIGVDATIKTTDTAGVHTPHHNVDNTVDVDSATLALEAGGNLAGAATSLAVIDDWDETNRCAVNPISGQVGVAGGSGTNGATVQRVTIATDDATAVYLKNGLIGEYETVAASQTDQALGATGGTGDYLAGLLIVPATVDAGAVSIKDGAGSAITIFTGGTGSVTNLVPFFVPLGITSASGAWQVTTGASVSCIGVGNFT